MRRHDTAAGLVEPVPVGQMETELAADRRRQAARRVDELERRRGQARHDGDLADVAEQTRRAELDRAEREATARANAELARMYRQARASGERIRITSAMARCGESRALRLERLRALNLKVLVPVLLGFAAWSTTGVHHGAARLMGIAPAGYGDPMWWALWLLEPVLIGAVVWIIIVRARLASAGGTLDPRAGVLAIGCLGTSVVLNFSAAIPTHAPQGVGGFFTVIGAMIAHGIGPSGAAATAHLIGVIDESISDADPWTGHDGRPVPLLADLNLNLTTATTEPPAEQAAGAGPESVVTKAEMQAAILADLIAAAAGQEQTQTGGRTLFSDADLAAWLDGGEPPAGGVTSWSPNPDVDGPQGASRGLPAAPDTATIRPGHIESGQAEGGRDVERPTDDATRVAAAAEARRIAGEKTRARIAAYMAKHPAHTIEQTAAALKVSAETVKRHRRNIRREIS